LNPPLPRLRRTGNDESGVIYVKIYYNKEIKMSDFKNWRLNRILRLFLGAGLIISAVLFYREYFMVIFSAGVILLATALSKACPFNVCAVKVPVKNNEK